MSSSNKNIRLFENSEIRKVIEEYQDMKPSDVAIKLSKWPFEERNFIVNQIQGRKKAKDKFPFLYKEQEIIYPLPISIEQTSSEKTAQYKAALFRGKTFIDLSCGFGIDAYFISKSFQKSTLVDTNSALLALVEHNFKALNVNSVSFIHSDAKSTLYKLKENVDLIYLDPSRRVEKKKVFLIDDCEPNVIELIPELIQKSHVCLIKLSPMLDISDIIKKIQKIDRIDVVALDGECKEILLTISEKASFEGIIQCVDLGKKAMSYSFSRDEENNLSVECGSMLTYLYEPNVSIFKAGAFKSIARDFNLIKLSTNTHLYTSTDLNIDFPGKIFKVTQTLHYNKKALKNVSTEKGFNIHLRNFADGIDVISKKLGITVSGKKDLFAYRNWEDKPELTLCSAISV